MSGPSMGEGEWGYSPLELEQNSLRVCLGGMFEGSWDCARIDVLGRSKLLAWGGDQAGEEAEGRRLWEVFLPRQEALKVTEDVWRREQPSWRGVALLSPGPTCPQASSLLIL